MKTNNNERMIGWILGLVEGEGNFSVEISKANDKKKKEKVQLNFNVTQHQRNEKILNILLNYFNCGSISINNKNTKVKQFRVRNYKELEETIIPFFELNNLKGIKQLEFEDFNQVFKLKKIKEHLTEEGLTKIKVIKEGKNRGRK